MIKEKVCAVYIIRNINSGKVYIGSSRNYYSRKAAYETALRHDHHVSCEMQKDFNRGDRFEFEILEVFLKQQQMKKFPQENENLCLNTIA